MTEETKKGMDGSALLSCLLVPRLQKQLALSRMQRAAKPAFQKEKVQGTKTPQSYRERLA